MKKALAGIFTAFLAAIAAAQFAYQATEKENGAHGNEAWAQDRMEFVSWNNERWTAWVHDDAFEKLPADDAKWHRHANRFIAYVDWDGEEYQARVAADGFLLARHGDWDGDVEISDAIRYRDWTGTKQIRTIAELRR